MSTPKGTSLHEPMDCSNSVIPTRIGLCRGTAWLVACLLLAAGPVYAQSAGTQGSGGATGRFLVGPLELTPTLVLREAGVDDNVFDTPLKDPPQRDTFVTFAPMVDAVMKLGIMDFSSQGTLGYYYFDRLKNLRTVTLQGNARAEFPLQRIRPAIAGSYQDVTDRPNNEIDVRVRRLVSGSSGTVSTRLTSRSAVIVGGSYEKTTYDRSTLFRKGSIAEALDKTTTEVSGAFRVDLTPLTFLTLDVRGSRDQFLITRDRQTDNLRATMGLEFAPDAVIKGRASFGYHEMVPRGQGGFPFAGWTSAVDLSYSFLGRTRLDGRFSRDAVYSVIEGEGYYVSTLGGGEILHNLIGPLDVTLRASRERLDYTFTPGGNGPRVDYSTTSGGGLSVRVSPQMRIGVNYELTYRESSAGSEFEYQRRRIFSTATYGF